MEKIKDPKKVKQGKKNKAAGAVFELKVRKDLEANGWIVDKWSNNLECVKFDNDEGNFSGEIKIIPAKRKFNPFNKVMAIGTGFPDFIAFKRTYKPYKSMKNEDGIYVEVCEVIGVESKINSYLNKTERKKCKWYLDNRVFSKILIASKERQGRKIIVKYKEFIYN